VSLLREYNGLLERSGLPPMEVGLGIAYQDSPPLYLMDGEHRIMISDAINASDRLSSCSKRVRKKIAPDAGVFQVYSLQIGGGEQRQHRVPKRSGGDAILNYNVGGICLSEAAFQKLQQEISLAPWAPDRESLVFPRPWIDEQREFFVGTVPIANGMFRKIAIRKNRIAQVDVRDLSILKWTDRWYYEVCANPAVYAALPGEKSATAQASGNGLDGLARSSRGRPAASPSPFRNSAEPEMESPLRLRAPPAFPLFPQARISSGPRPWPRRNPAVRRDCSTRESRLTLPSE
jgi:hypothetical protein